VNCPLDDEFVVFISYTSYFYWPPIQSLSKDAALKNNLNYVVWSCRSRRTL